MLLQPTKTHALTKRKRKKRKGRKGRKGGRGGGKRKREIVEEKWGQCIRVCLLSRLHGQWQV